MDKPVHVLSDLFDQLGLPSDNDAIEAFIAEHLPLPEIVLLADAPFWNEGQRRFLKEEWEEDADWVPLVDTLNTRLR